MPHGVMESTGMDYFFNGVNSSVVIKNSTNFQTQNEITLSAWIKPCLSQMDYIIGKAPAYVLRLTPAGQVVFLWQQGGSWKISQSLSDAVQNDTWTHVAAVYNGTNMVIYVNGKVSGYPLAISGPMDLTNRTLQIGYDSWFLNSSFNGVIDDVRIYNRSLNAHEVNSLYLNSNPTRSTSLIITIS